MNIFVKCNFIIILICCIYCSCSHYPKEIDDALKQAGSNRKELERVLEHYKKKPADSLKFKAAEFLIANMPGKYSEIHVPFENFEAVIAGWDETSTNKDIITNTYELNKVEIREDLKYITADYLINNIDLAFRMWKHQPWGKHISFDTFCEEILPYRVDREPLEDWRKKILLHYTELRKSLKNVHSSIQACSIVCKSIYREHWPAPPISLPPMNYTMTITSSHATCNDRTVLTIYIMRALGIPVTKESTPQWANMNTGHLWNAVRDDSGAHISFQGTETLPGEPNLGKSVRVKVYRQTFQEQNNIIDAISNIPPLLRNQCIKDVSSEYPGYEDVNIPIINLHKEGYAYLAITNRETWSPVCWGFIDGDSANFSSVSKILLYLPVTYIEGRQIAINYPFVFNSIGKPHFFNPDTSNLQNITLSQIHPKGTTDYNNRMHKGIFEGANQSDFSDAKILSVIEDIPNDSFNSINLKTTEKYRYIRYISPPAGFGNVAEIEFYNKDSQLKGKIIGTPGSWDNSSRTCDKVFDGNPHTYYDAIEMNGAWVGMDFNQKETITKIRYLPRNSENVPLNNQIYTLFYWSIKGWKPLGKQSVSDNKLFFQAPSNALFYLQNTNENTRVFIIENGKQKWL